MLPFWYVQDNGEDEVWGMQAGSGVLESTLDGRRVRLGSFSKALWSSLSPVR